MLSASLRSWWRHDRMTTLNGEDEMHACETMTGGRFGPCWIVAATVLLLWSRVAAQKLVLAMADLAQEITVSSATAVEAAAANNADAISVDTTMLDSLPMFDRDYVATVSRFLDTGSLGSGGVTVVVNGMEVSAL